MSFVACRVAMALTTLAALKSAVTMKTAATI
jgi:hypothetical protein